ncbi:hypothetical protein [Aporhodopirellula aestuarii]|uniref:Uncharacterized protein n=1 Tax=Aporhodopirellula aestuarii TaxID=2950107 RepID=A0ABT0UC89_9BACT|nr:hypothetical protein [Aporhodopirellula aestuarii]MCM2374432.1 hypothetical protein [Aporhodopirellula aestuarii]
MKKVFVLVLVAVAGTITTAWVRPDLYQQAQMRFPVLPSLSAFGVQDQPELDPVLLESGEYVPVDEETFRYLEGLYQASKLKIR